MAYNEEALNDAYNDFKSGGYTDTREDFSKLLVSNPDAFKDAYSSFTDQGYDGSGADFAELLGLKTKKKRKRKKKKVVADAPKPRKVESVLSPEMIAKVDKDGDGYYDNTQTKDKPLLPVVNKENDENDMSWANVALNKRDKKEKQEFKKEELEVPLKKPKTGPITITPVPVDITRGEEEEAIKTLTTQYGRYDFTFKEYGATDNVVIVAPPTDEFPKGEESEPFSIDNWLDKNDVAAADAMTNWMQDRVKVDKLTPLLANMSQVEVTEEQKAQNIIDDDDLLENYYYNVKSNKAEEEDNEKSQKEELQDYKNNPLRLNELEIDKGVTGVEDRGRIVTEKADSHVKDLITKAKNSIAFQEVMSEENLSFDEVKEKHMDKVNAKVSAMGSGEKVLKEGVGGESIEDLIAAQEDPNNYEIDDPKVREKVLEYLKQESHARSLSTNVADMVDKFEGGLFAKGGQQKVLEEAAEKELKKLAKKDKEFVSKFNLVSDRIGEYKNGKLVGGIDHDLSKLKARNDNRLVEITKIRNKKYTTQEEVDSANARMEVLREQALADQGSYEGLLIQRKQFVASAAFMQKEQGELRSKQEDLDVYFKAIGRNYQVGTVLGVTFANAAIDIGANIEEFAYALNPYVAIYDYMDKEDVSPLVKSLITGTSMINPASGIMAAQAQLGTSGDGVDEQGNPTGSYRDQMVSDLYNFQEEMRNSIAEPISMDEINGLGDLGMWAGTTIAQQLPLLALMYATGGTAIGTIGGRSFTAAEGLIFSSSAGGKFRGMKREMDLYDKTMGKDGKSYNWLQLYSTAMLTGAAEALSEQVTLGQMKTMKGAMGGNKAARLGFDNWMKKEIWTPDNLKYLAKDFLEEGGSEALATISENLIDMHIAGNEDVNIWDGVKESFASGVLISGTMKAPTLYRAMSAPFRSTDTNQKVGENAARINKLEKMAQNPDVLPANKAAYEAEIADLVIENNNLIGTDVKRVDDMTDAEKATLIKIEKENHFYRQRAERIAADGSLTEAQKADELRRLREKVDNNKAKKGEIIRNYSPEFVEKSYKDRMAWLRGQATLVEQEGGAPINIIETDTDGMMEYQTSQEADEITYNQGLTKAMNEVVKDPDSTPDEIAEAKAYLKAAKQQGKGIKNMLNIFKGNASNYGAMLPKFDADGNITSYDLLVNKETSITDGMFNTAAHEFIHAALYNTLKQDSAAQTKFGDALTDVWQDDTNASFTDKGMEIFNRRVNQYSEAEGRGEEIAAISSELMLDGEMELTEKGLNKVKGIFRRFAQNKLGYDIKFDTADDVRNFMIDFHKSVNDNKPSRAIARLTAKGAAGKLVDDARSPQEKADQTAFSKAVDLNQKSNPDLRSDIDGFVKNEDGTLKFKNNAEFKNSPEYTEAYMKIVDSKLLDGLIHQGMLAKGLDPAALKDFTRKVKDKIAERYATNYNLDKNDSLFGWLTGVSGGAGKSIIYRAKGDVMVEYVKEGIADQTSLDKPVGEAGTLADILQAEKSTEMEAFENEDLSPGRKDAYVNGPVPVLDQLELTDTKNEVDSKVDKIQKGENKVNLDGLTYKGVKSLLIDAAKVDKNGKMKAPSKVSDVKPTGALYGVLEAVAREIGVDPKRIIANQDLDAKQRKAVKQFLYTKIVNEDGSFNRTILDDVLPEGETRSGEATGIANTKLGLLYDKGGRASFAEGATAAGKFTQTKRTDVTMEEMLDVVGINPDGSFQAGTASDGALRQMVLQIAQLAGNQSLRENALKNGTHSEAVIAQLGDGKAETAWSKRDSRKQPITQDVISNGWGDLINEVAAGTLTNKEVTDAIENVYGNTVKNATKNKITKQILEDVNKFININENLKQGFETITGKNKAEFLIEQFEGRQIEQGLRKAFGTLLPKGLSIGNLAKDATSVTKQRAHLVSEAKNIIDQFGPVKGLEMIISQLGPVYSDMSKIGDGSLTVAFPGGPVIINKDFVGPSQNRNQVTTSIGDFIALVNKAGIEVRKKKGTKIYEANIDGEFVDLNTALIPEDSEAFIKNKDFEARKQQAQDARDITQVMLDNAWKKVNNPNDSFDVGDFALLTMSMGTSMKSPIRRAANAEYIQDGIEGVIARGKKAGKAMKDIVRFEHMKSKEAVASEIIASYINSGKLNPKVWDGYQVQVISVTADNLMNKVGLKTLSPIDGSPRLYNEATLAEIKTNPKLYPMKDIGPIRSMDPAKQGTETEAIGERWVNLVNNITKNLNLDQFNMNLIANATLQARPAMAWSKNTKGISVLDFDDTLATTKSLVRYTALDGTSGTLNAEQYASRYQDMLDKGHEFDFSEFNKVVKGKIAPLFQKALKLQKKFGSSNMFVLTARPIAAQQAIFDFLKANGLNIPLKNITGLGNSTSEAKALWIAEKVGDGYNDFYFADDALQNVQAVKNMLDQFDVKSKVQQARLQFSKTINTKFNNILEDTTGVQSEKVFSDAQAKIRGHKSKYKSIIPPSAQDFAGLLYNFLGKGKKGEADMAFFKKTLIDPFARGINELNASKQSAANDYKNLQKAFPQVKKIINKNIEGTSFTNDQAARVYLWDKAGFQVPGLSKRDLKTLIDHVNANPDLQAYAEGVGLISKKQDGYSAPGDFWLAENITSDLLSDGAIGDARIDFLAEWQQNVNQVFSPENLNKIEAIYGSKFREALQDVLYRMETGRNRPTGGGRLMNMYMNWVNNSVGAIMFFNMRSAILQTISATNYINWSFNNPVKAAAAFANQPQYWKDFSMIFNSPYLKQRRAGNQRGINEAELSAAVAGTENKAKAAITWLLKKGFLPTQIADSFAISSGGATFYRNLVNKYVKEGMTQEQAENQAFLDFQETTEVSQQSARPDMISQQQASPLGRLILSFQNTPMQYARIINKAARDLTNGRGDSKTHISKIAYYGVAQSILFGALQSALFAALGDDEEEEYDKKKERILNGMIDSLLSGIGYGGKAISTVKNTMMEYLEQRDKGFRADHAYTILSILGFSPPIGSKLRKIYSSIQTEKFNKDVFLERGFTLDNPIWSAIGSVVEGVTNVPLGRIAQKMLNIDNAIDSNNEWWQRVALVLGWNTWDLGIKDKDIEQVKTELKEEKKEKKKIEVKKKKELKKEKEKEENKAVIKENKEKSKKDGICSAISKGGKRCKSKAVNGGFCTVHESAPQRVDGKKTQCKKIKSDKKRCGMKTSNKSGYCYYHD